jgi:hypothetical protein
MKVKVSRQELNECLNRAINRVLSEANYKSKREDGFNKASKSANRDMEREYRGDGFKCYDRVHDSEKHYNRRKMPKINKNNYMDIEEAIETSNPYDDMPYNPNVEYGYEDIIRNDDNQKIYRRLSTNLEEGEVEIIKTILQYVNGAKMDIDNNRVVFIVPSKEVKTFEDVITKINRGFDDDEQIVVNIEK